MKGKEYLQPITIKSHDRTTNDRNIMFYTPPTVIRRIGNGILSCCKCLGKYLLSDDNKKQLKALYPGFVFNELAKFVRLVQALPGIPGIQLISLLCKELNTIKFQMLKWIFVDFIFQIETIKNGLIEHMEFYVTSH